MQIFIHYFLHFGLPLLISIIFFKKQWKKVYLIFISTMLIDLDHLFANPIFDANRCSINFHPLHTYYAFAVYIIFMFLRKPFNIIGIGLALHIITDLIDCLIMYSNCITCFEHAPALNLLQYLTDIM